MAASSSFSLTIDISVHGYYVYCLIWEPVIGEELQCEREPENIHDRYTISVVKQRQIVGHVPRTISRPCSVFIQNGGVIKCTVTGNRRHCSCADIEQGGMEIPCTLLHWRRKLEKKAVWFIPIQKV